MNILESILAAQGGAPIREMGARAGLDADQARTALEALMPMLAGAVNHQATQPGGLDALLGALQDGHHQRYLDDPAALREATTLEDGNAILGHLFGSKDVSREVASRVSTQTGIGADALKQLLPLVAALLMGGLSKGAAAGGAFGAPAGGSGGSLGGGGLGGGLGGALGEMLSGALGAGSGRAGAQAGPQGGLLDMLAPMLDRNRDGSALDDILGMASQFLGGRR